jgi:hypothetical protein
MHVLDAIGASVDSMYLENDIIINSNVFFQKLLLRGDLCFRCL